MEQRFATLPIKLHWLNAPMSCRQTIIPAWFSNVMKERFAALPVELHWLIDPASCRQTVESSNSQTVNPVCFFTHAPTVPINPISCDNGNEIQ